MSDFSRRLARLSGGLTLRERIELVLQGVTKDGLIPWEAVEGLPDDQKAPFHEAVVRIHLANYFLVYLLESSAYALERLDEEQERIAEVASFEGIPSALVRHLSEERRYLFQVASVRCQEVAMVERVWAEIASEFDTESVLAPTILDSVRRTRELGLRVLTALNPRRRQVHRLPAAPEDAKETVRTLYERSVSLIIQLP